MCTVTFIPRANGYLLGMNRDENIARGAGNPEAHRLAGARAVFPCDKAGGTWIACNEYGITLALLNWNIPVVQQSPQRSRGLIIPHLLPLNTARELHSALAMYELVYCAPFRLVAVIPGERSALQWSWDGAHLARRAYAWEVQHWFSSSASDNRAQELRSHVCSRAAKDTDAGSVSWLRRLHQSHENGPGAFSICVHRELVETLSFTEVLCTRADVSMLHIIGSPCNPRETNIIKMRRLYSVVSTEQKRIKDVHVCRA